MYRVKFCGQKMIMITEKKKRMESEERKGDLIENPDFTIRCRLGDTMAIIMKQNSLRLGNFATREAELAHIILGRIQLDLKWSLIKKLVNTEMKRKQSEERSK